MYMCMCPGQENVKSCGLVCLSIYKVCLRVYNYTIKGSLPFVMALAIEKISGANHMYMIDLILLSPKKQIKEKTPFSLFKVDCYQGGWLCLNVEHYMELNRLCMKIIHV